MRPLTTIAAVELRRFLRDRSNIFFVFIFPLLLVLVLGSQFGGEAPSGRVAIAGGADSLRATITAELEADGVSVSHADRDAVLEQVARGRTDVGVFVPGSASAAFDAGDRVTLDVVPGSRGSAPATEQQVRTALEAVQLRRAQAAALVEHGADRSEAQAALGAARKVVAGPQLQIVDVDEIAQEFSGLGQFDLGASSQLLLFVFLISLAGSATLIQARRQGVIARTLSAPVSTGQVLVGHALGRWTIAVFQGGYIMLATALLFGVDWGNPLLSLLVLAVFGAVAAGATMLLGALMDNEAAASGLGVGLGLVLAGLGGGMVPLEIFSDTLRQVAHLTPHAWAYEALAEIQRHEAGLVDVLPQLGVLAAMAAAVLLAGSWALRRSLIRAM
jgi:ABC-2 type transport system permease protein